MRPVILNRFGNGFNLRQSKKFPQKSICPNHLGGNLLVTKRIDIMSKIMISRNHINNIIINVGNRARKFKAPPNNIVNMTNLMTRIIPHISRKDVSFDT